MRRLGAALFGPIKRPREIEVEACNMKGKNSDLRQMAYWGE